MSIDFFSIGPFVGPSFDSAPLLNPSCRFA